MASTPDSSAPLYRRLYLATLFLVVVVLVGATGYHYLGEGKWGWLDCLYMTVITLSTVGYAETLPGMRELDAALFWTMALIVLGSGTLLYFVSSLTALIIEGDIGGYLRRRRMSRRIEDLNDHIVVCGTGSTGMWVVQELVATHTPFVAVDQEESRILRLTHELGMFPYVVGDATVDTTLEEAGIVRAKGVVSALPDDKDNIFVAITARALNPAARIVSKSVEPGADSKLRRAGADSAVSPNYIGGMRLASEMIRPSVVEFLDRMLRDRDKKLRIEEIDVADDSPLVGKTLAAASIRDRSQGLVVAARKDDEYVYNPGGDLVIQPGMTLIVIADTQGIQSLREHLGAGAG